MTVSKLNWSALWLVVALLLSLTDVCKGQSSTGGVNIGAVIVAVVIILIILCITMPICIVCLTVALCCTCRHYKKKKNEATAGNHETKTVESKSSVQNLPLPPIPTKNEAYGVNSDLVPTQANDAYCSGLYMTVDQDGIGDVVKTSHSPQELPPTTTDTVMQGNEAYGVKSDLGVPMETNEAYGSKQEESQDYELAAPSAPPTSALAPTDENTANHHKQLPDGTDYYNYYDYI